MISSRYYYKIIVTGGNNDKDDWWLIIRVSKLSSNAPNKNVKVLFFDQNALQFEINKNLWISPINPRPSMWEIFKSHSPISIGPEWKWNDG